MTLKLPGKVAAQVRGQVKGPDGNPIAGVKVNYTSVTDAGGRFDLGWVSPRRGGRKALALRFLAPRPAHSQAAAPPAETRFYHHKELAVELAEGKEVSVSVVLEPAELMTLSGEVLAHDGTPEPSAKVLVWSGKAGAEDLERYLYPERFMNSIFTPAAVLLARTQTDEKGRWSVRIADDTSEGFKLRYMRPAPEPRSFTLAAQAQNGAMCLLAGIGLDRAKEQRRIDLRLGPAPVAGTVSGQLVDPEGQPLAGFRLSRGRFGNGVETGSQGRFLFTGCRGDWISIQFRPGGWSFIEPTPGLEGRIVRLEGVSKGLKDVRLVMGRNAVLTGAVRWDTGQPVVCFQVSGKLGMRRFCNPEGRFRLENFPSGESNLTIKTVHGFTQSSKVSVRPGTEKAVEVVIPEPCCTIKGRIIDASGSPTRGIVARVLTCTNFTSVLPGEDGAFEFKVPPGECDYVLGASPASIMGMGGRGTTKVSVAKDHPLAEVTLTPPPPRPRRRR